MLMTIARYSFPYEAQIAKSRLAFEGIPAHVADEHTINMQWLYSNAMGGVRLQVPAAFVEQAEAILKEDAADAVDESLQLNAPVCAECGSRDLVPYDTGKRWAFLVFIALHFPLFPVEHKVRCNACGAIQP